MSAAIVSAGARSYAVHDDCAIVWRAVATGRLIDDADGSGAGLGAAIVADEPLLTVRTSADRYALMGDPDVALADTSVPHPLVLSVTRAGYRPALVALTVPADLPRPVVQDITLRKLPFVVTGTVRGLTGGLSPRFDPVANATLSIDGPIGPGGERALLLRRSLARTLGAGATLRGRTLAPQGAVHAVTAAAAGDDHVVLVDGTGVAAGQLLRFGDPSSGHWAAVAGIAPDPDRSPPATIVYTTTPLDAPVAAGPAIARFTPGPLAGATGTPQGPAYVRENVVWLDALPNGGDVLVVREAGEPDRFHDRDIVTNAAGDYRIAGMARMGSVAFRVAAAGFPAQTRSFPAARLAGAPLDWRLTP
jgi:hypothetical protein